MFVCITHFNKVIIRSFTSSGRNGQLETYVWEIQDTPFADSCFFSRHFGTYVLTPFIFCFCLKPQGGWKCHLVLIFSLQPGIFSLDSVQCSGRVCAVAVLLPFALCSYTALKSLSPNGLCC